jgi:hypothetical protein
VTPTIGRIVTVLVPADSRAGNNNAEVAPAVIVRVWGGGPVPDAHTVNARVLYDGPEVGWGSSIYLFPDEAAARAWVDTQAEQRAAAGVAPIPAGTPANFVAFWPARV